MMYRDCKGFTLIEVMSAMVIFSIAVTAAFATFEFQQKSYTTQSRLSETQKNVREAMELISRDVRLAGYGIPGDVTMTGILPGGATSIRGIITVDNTAGPDQIYLLYLYDMDGNQPATSLAINTPFTANAAGVSVDSSAGFVAGDLFMVVNDAMADLYKVSGGNPVPNPLPCASGPSPNYNTGHSNLRIYAADNITVVAKARFVKYYIDSTTDSDHPTLMLDKMNGQPPQPVADDIEDMQFQYTLDNGALSQSPADPARIRQVRILLSGRTRQVEKGWSEARPQVLNHPAGAATGHRRRMLDMTVDVRNAGL